MSSPSTVMPVSRKIGLAILSVASLGTSLSLILLFTQIKSVSSQLSMMLIFFTIVLIGLLLFLFIHIRKQVKPVAILAAQIQRLADGEIPAPVVVDRSDDIGQMASDMNRLADNLKSATEFAKHIGAGKLDSDISVFGNKGELSQALYAMRDNLSQVAEEDGKRNWATEGLARFAEILRANTNVKLLADDIIANLVRYTSSNQGSLFVIHDTDASNSYLELLACYAYDRKKFMTKTIEPGQGLVGQVFLEKQSMFLTRIPSNYITITSGLGEATPTSLLLVPLQVNGDIVGVVELAAFREYPAHVIAFVEKLAENIASTIINTRVNERTERLLHASQQQAEELRSQEEEMRQNMEEMQATQEEMGRKSDELARASAEMDGMLTGINATMATIEFTPEGEVLTANENFLRVMKYSLHDIRGAHHRKFVPPDILDTEDYRQFWRKLAAGHSMKGTFRRIDAAGNTVWLNAIYTPIFDARGQVKKVVKFATDITAEQELLAQSKDLLRGIDATMAMIEFTPDGLILKANDNFLKAMGYTHHEVTGKHHRMFVPKAMADSLEYKNFWSTLANGEPFRGVFERVTADGRRVLLNAIYNPIRNSEGIVCKVVKFATVVNGSGQELETVMVQSGGKS